MAHPSVKITPYLTPFIVLFRDTLRFKVYGQLPLIAVKCRLLDGVLGQDPRYITLDMSGLQISIPTFIMIWNMLNGLPYSFDQIDLSLTWQYINAFKINRTSVFVGRWMAALNDPQKRRGIIASLSPTRERGIISPPSRDRGVTPSSGDRDISPPLRDRRVTPSSGEIPPSREKENISSLSEKERLTPSILRDIVLSIPFEYIPSPTLIPGYQESYSTTPFDDIYNDTVDEKLSYYTVRRDRRGISTPLERLTNKLEPSFVTIADVSCEYQIIYNKGIRSIILYDRRYYVVEAIRDTSKTVLYNSDVTITTERGITTLFDKRTGSSTVVDRITAYPLRQPRTTKGIIPSSEEWRSLQDLFLNGNKYMVRYLVGGMYLYGFPYVLSRLGNIVSIIMNNSADYNEVDKISLLADETSIDRESLFIVWINMNGIENTPPPRGSLVEYYRRYFTRS